MFDFASVIGTAAMAMMRAGEDLRPVSADREFSTAAVLLLFVTLSTFLVFRAVAGAAEGTDRKSDRIG